MHFLTLSWDDGFQKSSLKTAEILEKFGLRAEFNIVAKANLPNNGLPYNMQPDACWGAPYGDFQQPTGWIRTLKDNLRLSVQRLNGTGILVAGSGARLPDEGRCDQTVKLTTGGSEEAEAWLDLYLRGLMGLPAGWLIYNVHGLDGEGWGPLRSEYLTRTLERLVGLPDLKILPAREILALAKQRTLFVLYD